MPKKDNSGIKDKIALRKRAIEQIKKHTGDLVVLDAYAGSGKLYERFYRGMLGVAMDSSEEKCAYLANQRPTWPVYECDAPAAIAAGIASNIPFSIVDIDPYGDPWPCISAFLDSDRQRSETFVLAVNDGLRQSIKMGIAWRVRSMHDAVMEFGTDLNDRYLEICRWMIEKKSHATGYSLVGFEGFYGGHAKQMSHYYALIKQA
jgi:hypothetical protein